MVSKTNETRQRVYWRTKQESDNLQYNTLGCWEERHIDQASDVPRIIIFQFLAKIFAKIVSIYFSFFIILQKIKNFEYPKSKNTAPNIRHLVVCPIDPASQRIILKIVGFQNLDMIYLMAFASQKEATFYVHLEDDIVTRVCNKLLIQPRSIPHQQRDFKRVLYCEVLSRNYLRMKGRIWTWFKG